MGWWDRVMLLISSPAVIVPAARRAKGFNTWLSFSLHERTGLTRVYIIEVK